MSRSVRDPLTWRGVNTQTPPVQDDPKPDRTAYWGTCDDCMTGLVIYPHPDRATNLPRKKDWVDRWPDCPVCGTEITIEGSSPVAEVIRD